MIVWDPFQFLNRFRRRMREMYLGQAASRDLPQNGLSLSGGRHCKAAARLIGSMVTRSFAVTTVIYDFGYNKGSLAINRGVPCRCAKSFMHLTSRQDYWR
jgi:hypothetical protein